MRKGNHFLSHLPISPALCVCALMTLCQVARAWFPAPLSNTSPLVTPYPVTTGFDIPDTPRVIDCVILHSSYYPMRDDTFNTEGIIQLWRRYRVAPHYFICRDGSVLQLVPDAYTAHHAGKSVIPATGENNVNSRSIGIEIASTPTQGPTDEQYDALLRLVRDLRQRYPIVHILRHSDIAPRRKTDPWGFDWEWFLDNL